MLIISVLIILSRVVYPIQVYKMRLFRRYLKYFSTVVVFSCCYMMLFKAKPNTNLALKDNIDLLKPALMENEMLTMIRTSPPATTNSKGQQKVLTEEIEYLPGITEPSMDPNRTLNWLDLWSNDTFCNQFTVHLLGENTIEPRALVSFPGSGNTWLRMLLMGLTGLYVDTVYPSDELFYSKAGSAYELKKDCNCTLLQKTHDLSLFSELYNLAYINKTGDEARRTGAVKQFHGNGILVIRNPFKAILSYRNFAFGGNMAGLAPPEAFSQDLGEVKIGQRRISTWDRFITRSVAAWETLATVWIRGLKRGGVLYYEKLRRETGPQLIRLAKMLGISNVNKHRLKCVLDHNQHNTFKRSETGPINYPKNPFTESQHLLILKSIESVQMALKERGLDALPVEFYDFFTPMYEYGFSR